MNGCINTRPDTIIFCYVMELTNENDKWVKEMKKKPVLQAIQHMLS